MARLSRTWLTATAAAAVLTLVFALLALALYERTERGVVEKHSQDQQLLAELAATAFAQRVDTYLHRADANAAPLGGLPEKQREAALGRIPALAPEGTVFLVGADGRLYFRDAPKDLNSLEAAVVPWRGAAQPVLTNPFPPAGENSQVALLLPLASERGEGGQVGFTLPFGPLVETLVTRGSEPAHLSLSLLDERGQVLANTRHPEMIGRQLPGPGQNCLPCHTSFALERRMVAGEAGAEQLQVGREPLALVAFTPARVLGRQWSLALSEPYSAITADTRRGFRGITLLLGLLLLTGIAGVTLTLQYRGQRRRAEERARHAERRAALERQLRQSEQLASIGKMTSQIAHQINTPLATLGLNVAYLRTEVARRPGGGSPAIEEVSDAIAEEIDRLKRVVNDYLRFARLPQAAPSEESLAGLLRGLVDFLEPEARERRVHLEAELGRDPAVVALDADLFRQALLNLARNSFEAMPEGGTLRLRLRRREDAWELELEDTGRGIPPEALARIFDPFFTTKKDGTGLGLAHTRRVVEEHGGTIECRSAPGQGTTFLLRLPAAAGAPESGKPDSGTAETEKEFSLSEKGR